MTKELEEAIENLGNIELSHIESDEDEDLDGNIVFTDYEINDGLLKEVYMKDYKIIQQASLKIQELEKKNQELLQALAFFKKKLEDTDNIKVATTMLQQLDTNLKLEKENKKMKDLLLELSDIDPDNVDCVNQCILVVNTILENNISEEINKACESNLRVLKEM